MKTIGLLGGMSWESSAHYYAILNREAMARLGHPHSARIVLGSVDFGEFAPLLLGGEWEALAGRLADEARRIEAAGAEALLICTNSMHIVADAVAAAVSIPLIHIGDPVGAACRTQGIGRVGLIGTAPTMEQGFLRDRLAERFGLDVIVPEADEREMIHRVIFDELIGGIINPASRDAYAAAIERLRQRGAEGVILACTEIMMLIGPDDADIPLFDTTRLHALAALDFALSS